MKSIYRKLKDYIYKDDNGICVVFGSLHSQDCEFNYKDEDGNWKSFKCCGIYGGEKDFLLNYYVISIIPQYEIVKDRIKPYLRIILRKEKTL